MASQHKRSLITAAKPSRLSNFHVRRNLLRRIGRELRRRIDSELEKLRRRMEDPPSMEGFIRVIRKSSFGQMTINDLLKDQEPLLSQSMPQSIYPMVKVKVEEEEEEEPMPQSMVKVKVEEEEEEETKPVLDSLEDVLASLTNAGFSSDLPVDLTLFNFSDLMDLSFTI